MRVTRTGDRFEIRSKPIDVTSLSRPDPKWKFVDAQGHVHQWYTAGAAATSYNPTHSYTLPTLVQVRDGTWFDDYGEEHELWHYACGQCGERVEPGTKADDCRQFIPGLKSFYINDRPVSKEEWVRRARAAGHDVPDVP